MTTTVQIAVTGNKQVIVESQYGKTRLQPGAHHTVTVHGDGEIKLREVGAFVSAPSLPLVRPFQEEDGDLD